MGPFRGLPPTEDRTREQHTSQGRAHQRDEHVLPESCRRGGASTQADRRAQQGPPQVSASSLYSTHFK